MKEPRYQFSQVVIIENDLIGVICKTWEDRKNSSYNYEVYVRTYNIIQEYPESQIKHFIFSKELSEDELDFYN